MECLKNELEQKEMEYILYASVVRSFGMPKHLPDQISLFPLVCWIDIKVILERLKSCKEDSLVLTGHVRMHTHI